MADSHCCRHDCRQEEEEQKKQNKFYMNALNNFRELSEIYRPL